MSQTSNNGGITIQCVKILEGNAAVGARPSIDKLWNYLCDLLSTKVEEIVCR